MDAASMFEFVEMILQTKPSLVVELGSGSSSIWIARALQMNGSGRLVSFDHLEKYADATRAALVRQGLDSLVEVRLAELRDVDLGETKHSWYDPSCFKDLQGIDLLLVDGPPGAVGPLARFPAFPVLKDRLADRSLIVVDDAIRPDEIKMMNRWMRNDSELAKLCDVGSRAKALVFHRPERKAGKRDNRA